MGEWTRKDVDFLLPRISELPETERAAVLQADRMLGEEIDIGALHQRMADPNVTDPEDVRRAATALFGYDGGGLEPWGVFTKKVFGRDLEPAAAKTVMSKHLEKWAASKTPKDPEPMDSMAYVGTEFSSQKSRADMNELMAASPTFMRRALEAQMTPKQERIARRLAVLENEEQAVELLNTLPPDQRAPVLGWVGAMRPEIRGILGSVGATVGNLFSREIPTAIKNTGTSVGESMFTRDLAEIDKLARDGGFSADDFDAVGNWKSPERRKAFADQYTQLKTVELALNTRFQQIGARGTMLPIDTPTFDKAEAEAAADRVGTVLSAYRSHRREVLDQANLQDIYGPNVVKDGNLIGYRGAQVAQVVGEIGVTLAASAATGLVGAPFLGGAAYTYARVGTALEHELEDRGVAPMDAKSLTYALMIPYTLSEAAVAESVAKGVAGGIAANFTKYGANTAAGQALAKVGSKMSPQTAALLNKEFAAWMEAGYGAELTKALGRLAVEGAKSTTFETSQEIVQSAMEASVKVFAMNFADAHGYDGSVLWADLKTEMVDNVWAMGLLGIGKFGAMGGLSASVAGQGFTLPDGHPEKLHTLNTANPPQEYGERIDAGTLSVFRTRKSEAAKDELLAEAGYNDIPAAKASYERAALHAENTEAAISTERTKLEAERQAEHAQPAERITVEDPDTGERINPTEDITDANRDWFSTAVRTQARGTDAILADSATELFDNPNIDTRVVNQIIAAQKEGNLVEAVNIPLKDGRTAIVVFTRDLIDSASRANIFVERFLMNKVNHEIFEDGARRFRSALDQLTPSLFDGVGGEARIRKIVPTAYFDGTLSKGRMYAGTAQDKAEVMIEYMARIGEKMQRKEDGIGLKDRTVWQELRNFIRQQLGMASKQEMADIAVDNVIRAVLAARRGITIEAKTANDAKAKTEAEEAEIMARLEAEAAGDAEIMAELLAEEAKRKEAKAAEEAAFEDELEAEGRVKFSFVGPKAKLTPAQKTSLENAEGMIGEDWNPEIVRKLTGWHLGADGKLRFEIPDDQYQIKIDPQIERPELDADTKYTEVTELGRILDHPTLFKMYPALKKVRVIFDEKMADGSGLFSNGNIYVGGPTPSRTVADLQAEIKGVRPYRLDARDVAEFDADMAGMESQLHGQNKSIAQEQVDTLFHEVQHWIQAKEGFARGTNETWQAILTSRMRARLAVLGRDIGQVFMDRYKSAREGIRDPDVFAADPVAEYKAEIRGILLMEPKMERYIRLQEEIDRRGEDGKSLPYYFEAGEVEARDVEKRLKLTAEERRSLKPATTAIKYDTEGFGETDFDPENATDNVGTFDPNNADIRFSASTAANPNWVPIERKDGRTVVGIMVPVNLRGRVDRSAEGPVTPNLDAIRGVEGGVDATAEYLRKNQVLPAELLAGDSETVLRNFIDFAKGNLRMLWDLYPEKTRERARHWYVGAHNTALAISDVYGVTLEQASAVLAVLSPKTDWFINANIAERIMHWNKRLLDEDAVVDVAHLKSLSKKVMKGVAFRDKAMKPGYDPEKIAAVKKHNLAAKDARRNEKEKLAKLLAAVEGKTFSQLSLPLRARVIRAYDEALGDRTYRSLLPEGGRGDVMLTKAKKPKTPTWSAYAMITKALSVIEDGSMANVSTQLGEEHKVRNFYNNIVDPHNPRGYVTIDTHAVSAAELLALSGEGTEVTRAFGGDGSTFTDRGLSRMYALYVQAHQELAAELSQELGETVLPREVQSVTWELVRELFTKKSQISKAIALTRKEYNNGSITVEEYRRRVRELGSAVGSPAWESIPFGNDPDQVGLASGGRLGGPFVPLGRRAGDLHTSRSTRKDSGKPGRDAEARNRQEAADGEVDVKFSAQQIGTPEREAAVSLAWVILNRKNSTIARASAEKFFDKYHNALTPDQRDATLLEARAIANTLTPQKFNMFADSVDAMAAIRRIEIDRHYNRKINAAVGDIQMRAAQNTMLVQGQRAAATAAIARTPGMDLTELIAANLSPGRILHRLQSTEVLLQPRAKSQKPKTPAQQQAGQKAAATRAANATKPTASPISPAGAQRIKDYVAAIRKAIEAKHTDRGAQAVAFRKTMSLVLTDFIEQLDHGPTRASLIEDIVDFATRKRIDAMETAAIDILEKGWQGKAGTSKEKIRVKTGKLLDKRGRKNPSEKEPEYKRSVPALIQRYLWHARRAFKMTTDELVTAKGKLTVVAPANLLATMQTIDPTNQDFDNLLQAHALETFGGLKFRNMNDNVNALDFIRVGLSQYVKDHVTEVKAKHAEYQQMREAILPGLPNLGKEGVEPGFLEKIAWGTFSLPQKIERLTFGLKNGSTGDLILRNVNRELFRAASTAESAVNNGELKFEKAIHRIIGAKDIDASIAEVRRERPEFARFSESGLKALTLGQVMHIVATLRQKDYAKNKGMDHRRALLSEMENAIGDKGEALLEWMQKELKAEYLRAAPIYRAMTGLNLEFSADPAFMAAKLRHISDDTAGYTLGMVLMSPAFARRVRNNHDVDENADIVNVYASRIVAIAQYEQFAPLYHKLRGIFTHPDMLKAFQDHLGAEQTADMLAALRDTFNGWSPTLDLSTVPGQLVGAFAITRLTFNPMQLHRQATSALGYYGAVIDTAGTLPDAARPDGYGTIEKHSIRLRQVLKWMVEGVFTKDGRDTTEMLRRTPQGQVRWRNSGQQALADANNLTAPQWLRVLAKTGRFFTQRGDAMSVLWAGQGVFRMIKSDLMSRGMPEPEAHAEALTQFWRVGHDVSQSAMQINKAQWQRTGGALARHIGVFTTAPQQQAGREMFAYMAWRYNKTNMMGAGRVVLANHIIMPFVFWSINMFISAVARELFTDDEYDEEEAKRDLAELVVMCLLGPYGGIFFLGLLLETSINIMKDKVVFDKVNPYNQTAIPAASLIESAVLSLGYGARGLYELTDGDIDDAMDEFVKGGRLMGKELAPPLRYIIKAYDALQD